MTRRLLIAVALLTAVAAGPAPSAGAYVAPGATVVSASLERQELADDLSTQVAISGDGRYVAFTTRARNFFADDDADPDGQFRAGGIFRRDLQSGKLELVSHGELRSEAAPDEVVVRGALNPSSSADGRYVVFSTGAQLVPDDTNGNVDVYVRDMAVDWRTPGAFDLVSRSDTDAAARYAPMPEGSDRPGINPGSEVTSRAAISADGRYVVFRTADIPSDLPGGAAIETPGRQVFVRDRLAGETRLITKTRGAGAPAGGAVGAAVISGDGSTVAWVGANAFEQTPFLTGEGENPSFEYYLWQRIADGPGAPTRRITGLVDPEDPGCAPGSSVIDSPTLSGPCYGPLGQFDGHLGGIVAQAPSLSFDGRRVLYLTNAMPRAVPSSGNATDAFVVDVTPGGARKAATLELTRDGGPTPASNAPIDGGMLSADGRWAVLATSRTSQVAQLLRPIGVARAVAGTRELALIDLQDRTIERVGLAAGGADPNGSVGTTPALDYAGRRIAFTSGATNLFFGDANDRPDVFVVAREDAPPASLAGPIDDGAGVDAQPPPAETPEQPATRLTVRARVGKGGKVTLRITAPEPLKGTLSARGTLRDAGGRKIGKSRVLANRSLVLKKRGTQSVTLTFAKSLRSKLKAAGKIPASARVEATGASGRQYVGRVTIEFRK